MSHLKRILFCNSPCKLWWRHNPRVTISYQELIQPRLIPLTYPQIKHLINKWGVWPLTPKQRDIAYPVLLGCILSRVTPGVPSNSLMTSWSASQDERVKGDSWGTVCMCVCMYACVYFEREEELYLLGRVSYFWIFWDPFNKTDQRGVLRSKFDTARLSLRYLARQSIKYIGV